MLKLKPVVRHRNMIRQGMEIGPLRSVSLLWIGGIIVMISRDMSMAQAPTEIKMTLYTKEIWEEFVSRIEENFSLKTYPHIDPFFNFPKDKKKLQVLVSDPTLTLVASHPFLPFIKTLQKTPRYRYQEDKESYDLQTKIRPISFASHFDTYLLSFYSFSLNKKYQELIKEKGIDKSVLAYRSDLNGKCNIQFAKEAFDDIKYSLKKNGQCSAIALDIKGYFDHIDHNILKAMWCEVLDSQRLPKDQYHLFKTLTKYSYINYNSFLKHFKIDLKKIKKEQNKKTTDSTRSTKAYNSILDLVPNQIAGPSFQEKMNYLRSKNLITLNRNKDRSLSKNGIPQGSSISALLSNIYLLKFDELLCKKAERENFTYRRYCDDLLITCDPKNVNELKTYIMKLMSETFKLTIQDKKTEIIDFKSSVTDKTRGFKREYNAITTEFIELPNVPQNFKNLQYLGFEFNGQNIYIRSGSLSRYFRKAKARIFKTVTMAYSQNSKSDKIFKKQLYRKYSHLGKRNFISYALNASKKFYSNADGDKKEGMNSPQIRRQVSRHMTIIQQEVIKSSGQRAKRKRVRKKS